MSDCALYLVSPPKIKLADFLPQADEAFGAGGVKAFQLRLKEASDEQILEAAKEIIPLCRKYDIAFLLNDDAKLAAKLGADGLHLGQEDMCVSEAREIVGKECIIGVSCHASREMAFDAALAGADYVAFGAFFSTTSKPKEKVEKWGMPEPEILTWWAEVCTLPSVAIGGMTPENCAPLVSAGADFIAAITSVWNHKDGPGTAVKEFMKTLNQK